MLVLLTDGLATAPDEEPELYALNAASSTRAADIEVYAIGLGANVNFEFIQAVASEGKAYQALSNTDIDRIYESITSSICEDGPAVIEIIPKTEATFEPIS